MAAQRYGLSKGQHEVFTVRAGPQMSADFHAHVIRQFIVDESRQCAKNAETPCFPRLMGPGGSARSWRWVGMLRHGRSPFATRARRGRVNEWPR